MDGLSRPAGRQSAFTRHRAYRACCASRLNAFRTAHLAFKEKRLPVFEGAEIVGETPKAQKPAKKKKKKR